MGLCARATIMDTRAYLYMRVHVGAVFSGYCKHALFVVEFYLFPVGAAFFY